MIESKNLEKQIADDLSTVLKEAKKMGCKKATMFSNIPLDNVETVIKALAEIQTYREINQRLKKIYGEFDDLLETAITYLEKHNGIDFPGSVGKSRLLTDGDVDRWEAYKALGTVEELRFMKEKSEPEKPLGYKYSWDCPRNMHFIQ